eukprot:TRINITY_DN75162_c0_g1_i1.p1 TRINITY_DN75162_c0_g1~~TRINITY_DN75162_c0_g1_i1.p1  ORF type:complete len:783 (-),score=137.85 TRINITY_DN75162_c0_g1_i1:411-2759(-)
MSQEIVLYGKGGFGGKGGKDDPSRRVQRRTVDYGSAVVRWMEDALSCRFPPHRLQRHYSYIKELAPPFATPQSPYDSICCRFVHSSTTKNRAPVNVVHWFPNGRRLLSGTQTGEIIIWNGFQFHFENILQAHNAAVRAMEWNPEETVLVSGDQLGIVKFWDQYLYNFQSIQAHKESICDISVAPTGLKFCSCADDSHAKVWDLIRGEEERAFTGHGWDVKCCAWHPTKGLVATGSKDSQIKLWDPRASEAITTIFCHKSTVTRVRWSPSGQWLASASRDHLVMGMDIRTMSVRKVFRAHTKEVTALSWHPESDALLASGGYDSAMHFWDMLGDSKPLESVQGAHDGPIWCLAWNPLGHLLVSGSHDYSTRFWSRARPGDTDFLAMLPPKVGQAAAEAAALAAASLPPAPPPGSVYESGIFAGRPGPPPTPEELKAQADAAAAAQAKANGLLAIDSGMQRTISGLSGGEGSDVKAILDTSDFDAEADQPTSKGVTAPVAEVGAALTKSASVVASATSTTSPALSKSAVAGGAAPSAKAASPPGDTAVVATHEPAGDDKSAATSASSVTAGLAGASSAGATATAVTVVATSAAVVSKTSDGGSAGATSTSGDGGHMGEPSTDKKGDAVGAASPTCTPSRTVSAPRVIPPPKVAAPKAQSGVPVNSGSCGSGDGDSGTAAMADTRTASQGSDGGNGIAASEVVTTSNEVGGDALGQSEPEKETSLQKLKPGMDRTTTEKRPRLEDDVRDISSGGDTGDGSSGGASVPTNEAGTELDPKRARTDAA